MAKKQSAFETSPRNQESKTESPLSFKNIIAGIIVTVLGGLILAYIIQDARFSPNQVNSATVFIPTATPIRTQSVILTLSPNSTQIVNSSTVIVNIDNGNTVNVYDGKIFITVNLIYDGHTVRATIGAPGCVNQEIKDETIGYAIIYDCGNKYDIRIGSITRRDKLLSVILGVEFYVTELEN
jgi:hypothetical protein